MPELRPRLFPFEDRQLLSQSGILQRDLFVASEDENDESQRPENRFEHEAVLWASTLLKINRIAFTPSFGEGQGTSAIRFSPPLVIDTEQAEFAVNTFAEALLDTRKATIMHKAIQNNRSRLFSFGRATLCLNTANW